MITEQDIDDYIALYSVKFGDDISAKINAVANTIGLFLRCWTGGLVGVTTGVFLLSMFITKTKKTPHF